MTNQTKNQKGFSPLLIIVLVLAAIAAVTLFLSSQRRLETQQLSQNTPSINNTSDLNTTSTDLDNTDMGQFDSDLNQLKVDASAF